MTSGSLPIRSLGINALLILIANVIASAALLVQFLIITHLFQAEEAGRYALQVAFLAPFFLAASFQQRRILATSAPDRGYGAAAHLRYFALSHAATAAVALVVFGIQGDLSILAVAVPIMALRTLENASDACYGFFQQQDRYRYLSISRWMHAAVMIGVTAFCGYQLQWSLWQILAATAVARLALSLCYEFQLAWKLTRAASAPTAEGTSIASEEPVEKNLIRLGLPLGVSGLMASLVGNTPQYVLAGLGRVELIPAFVILSRLALIGANVTRAVNEAFARPLTQAVAAANRVSSSKLLRFALAVDVAIGVTILTICQLAYGPLDPVLQMSANGATRFDLTCVFLSMIVNNVTGLATVVMSIFRNSRQILWLQGSSLVLVVAVSLCLIPAWGLTGALMSIAIGKLPSLFMSGWIISKQVRGLQPAAEETEQRIAEPIRSAA